MTSPLLFTVWSMFVAVLLLVGVIYSGVHWLIKAVLIGTSLGFAVIFYCAYVGALGYPAPITPPPLFRFVSGLVREPTQGDVGAVYIWVQVSEREKPRAIELPYSTENRRAVSEARKKILANEQVYLGVSPSGRRGRGQGSQGAASDDDLAFRLPPDTVPRKENQ